MIPLKIFSQALTDESKGMCLEVNIPPTEVEASKL